MIESTITVERRRSTPPTLPTPCSPSTEPTTSHDTSPSPGRRGTRSGWAMRLVYLTSDLIAIGLALAFSEICVALVQGAWPTFPTVLGFNLYVLLAVGLVFVASTLGTYSAIPPRPVRQFRVWVLGSGIACASLVTTSWLLGV